MNLFQDTNSQVLKGLLARIPSRTITLPGLHREQDLQREPDVGVTSVNYDFAELLARGEMPR